MAPLAPLLSAVTTYRPELSLASAFAMSLLIAAFFLATDSFCVSACAYVHPHWQCTLRHLLDRHAGHESMYQSTTAFLLLTNIPHVTAQANFFRSISSGEYWRTVLPVVSFPMHPPWQLHTNPCHTQTTFKRTATARMTCSLASEAAERISPPAPGRCLSPRRPGRWPDQASP